MPIHEIRLNPLLSEAVFSMKGGKNGDDLQAGSLNPLLSEAVFSMKIYRKEFFYGRRVLILF